MFNSLKKLFKSQPDTRTAEQRYRDDVHYLAEQMRKQQEENKKTPGDWGRDCAK